MIDEKKWLYLKKGVEALQREEAEAVGADKEAAKQLKKKFKCPTLAKAKSRIKKWDEQEKEKDEEFDAIFKAFKKDYGKALKALEAGDDEWYLFVPTSSKSSKRRKGKHKKARKGTKGR